MSMLHIYRDDHSGGWVREVRDWNGHWHRVGVYGTRAAASLEEPNGNATQIQPSLETVLS